MIKRSVFPAAIFLLFTPNLAQACSLDVDHCQMIHIGLVSIVFGMISGYHRRTAGSPFFRSLFKLNAGLYGLFILFFPTQISYGGSQCSDFEWLILAMPILALALVLGLADAARKARNEASDATEGPGAMRLGFSSAGLLLGALAIFFLTYSSEERSGWPYDSDVKANLHNYFMACKAYWAEEGGDNTCSLEIAKQASYGFIQSFNVEILSEGNESSFITFATHSKSNSVFQMDNSGDIEASEKSPFPPPPPPKTRWELFLKNIGVSETVPAG